MPHPSENQWLCSADGKSSVYILTSVIILKVIINSTSIILVETANAYLNPEHQIDDFY